MRIVLMTLAVLALAGCGAQQKSADTATTTAQSGADGSTASGSASPGGEVGGAAGSQAVVATAPALIEELTNQKLVYECPKCGMDFDAAGACSMDGSTLVATQVDYTCPKDGQTVEQAGKCPRCPMNARVEKTAMAATQASGKN